VTSGVTGTHVALFGGQNFTADELSRAQEAFRAAGKTGYKISGTQILVPRRESDDYAALLVVNRSLPGDFLLDEERLNRNIGLFTTEAHRREMTDSARKQRLSKILRAIPDLEDAWVEWDEQIDSGFRREKKLSATVYVRPRGGELSPHLVQSLRMFIAAAKAGLTQSQVTVFDLASGQAHGPVSADDPQQDRLLATVRLRTREYQEKIEQALNHIPHVRVAVNVDVDPTRSTVKRQQQLEAKPFPLASDVVTTTHRSTRQAPRAEPGVISNQPQSLTSSPASETVSTEESKENSINIPSMTHSETVIDGFALKSVQVAVSIPEDYYQSVAERRGHTAGTSAAEKQQFQSQVDAIKKETESNVQALVQQLVPVGSSANAVTVKSYTRVETPLARPTVSWLETGGDFAREWGSSIVLGLFAGWSVWLVSRGLRAIPAEPEAPPSPAEPAGAGLAELNAAPAQPPQRTRRDDLQEMVKDNPEMAASIVSRWIGSPKS
jgi:flagellar biosynthesis/type III secretory pathway M-ring protein FliF/YscJ